MADYVVGGRLGLKDDGATQTVGNFKKELKEASKSLVDVQSKFGATSKEAFAAAKRVAELKDSIQEAREVADLFDPGAKFQAFGNVVRTVAGGFSAFTGTMALFGAESKEVEEALLKVQAALALTEGLNTIADATKDFDRLKAVIMQTSIVQKGFALATTLTGAAFKGLGVSVATTSTAFKVLRTAIITTGIGALVVGIGMLIEKISEWTSATEEQEAAQWNLKDATDALTSSLDKELAANDRAVKIAIAQAKARGASAKELQAIERKGLEEARLITAGKIQVAKSEVGEVEALRKKEQETKDAILLYDLQKQAEAVEEGKRIRERQAQEAKARAEKAKEERDREQAEALENRSEFLKAQRDLNKESRQSERDEIAEFDAQFREQQAAEDEAKKEREAQAEADADAALEKWRQKEKESLDLAKQSAEERIMFNQAIGDSLGALSDIVGRETAVGKTLAVAQALISTYTAISKTLAAYAGVPIPGFAIAQAVAIGLAGLASVKNILKVQVPGKGVGGGGGGSVPSISQVAPVQPQAQITNTRLDQRSLNQIGNAASRSYVLESDVSSQQERVTRLNRAARLG